MEKVYEICKKIENLQRDARKLIEDFLNTCLKYNDHIYLYDKSGNPFCDEYITVCYDGGRHPEYNSNAFSCVYSIFKKNGKIYLEIDDSDEYDIERCNTDELFRIAELIDNYIIK